MDRCAQSMFEIVIKYILSDCFHSCGCHVLFSHNLMRVWFLGPAHMSTLVDVENQSIDKVPAL